VTGALVVVGGVFVVAFAISAAVSGRHRWIAIAGVAVTVAWWLVTNAVYGWRDRDITAGWGFVLIVGSLSIAWTLGVLGGYLVRRGVRSKTTV
jgi:hypothetical protein